MVLRLPRQRPLGRAGGLVVISVPKVTSPERERLPTTSFHALRELVELKINVSGVVLTQVDMTRHARYGYGGIDSYYHKYRKYYQN